MNTENFVNLFRTTVPNSRYIFRNGTAANFKGTEYITSDDSEIAQLNEEIRLKHPTIFVEPGREMVDPKMLDPMEVFKARIIKEYLEGLAVAAGNPNRDMGQTENKSIMPASSSSIAPVAAGGSGVSTFTPPLSQIPSNLTKALGLLDPADPTAFTQVSLENATMAPSQELDLKVSDAAVGAKAMSVFDVPLKPTPVIDTRLV